MKIKYSLISYTSKTFWEFVGILADPFRILVLEFQIFNLKQ